MLNPGDRSLYTAALAPPPGYVFDEAIGTTFSLDPAVLLTVPVHLALLGGKQGADLHDGLAVLEAVRRLADRITVYAQRGRFLVPEPPNPLYGLLESMAVEVNPRRGGVFHPKLWLLRYVATTGDNVLLRLLVSSRNITQDRSWDVALTLEGTPGGRSKVANRELADLIGALPALAVRNVGPGRSRQAERLAGELRRTKWELPPGFDTIKFSVLGLRPGAWSPPRSGRLAVISPFCTDDALAHLCRKTTPEALITRPETCQALAPETRARFGRCLVLDDAAETEDGEDADALARDTLGLHAKVFLFEWGWDAHLVLGSANATSAALLGASNVEVLTELVGKRSRVGGIDKLLDASGLGEVLCDAPETEDLAAVDPEQQAAEAVLDAAHASLVKARLRVVCTPGADGVWDLTLKGLGARGEGLEDARAWPITVPDSHAVAFRAGDEGQGVVFSGLAVASVTGLIAFELTAAGFPAKRRFVLNLPVQGLPEARDAAILQTVIRNRDGFLRYLMLLLGDLADGIEAMETGKQGFFGDWGDGKGDGASILESLVRAYSRAPERLQEVGRIISRVEQAPEGEAIVPAAFLDVWRVFEQAMEDRHD